MVTISEESSPYTSHKPSPSDPDLPGYCLTNTTIPPSSATIEPLVSHNSPSPTIHVNTISMGVGEYELQAYLLEVEPLPSTTQSFDVQHNPMFRQDIHDNILFENDPMGNIHEHPPSF